MYKTEGNNLVFIGKHCGWKHKDICVGVLWSKRESIRFLGRTNRGELRNFGMFIRCLSYLGVKLFFLMDDKVGGHGDFLLAPMFDLRYSDFSLDFTEQAVKKCSGKSVGFHWGALPERKYRVPGLVCSINSCPEFPIPCTTDAKIYGWHSPAVYEEWEFPGTLNNLLVGFSSGSIPQAAPVGEESNAINNRNEFVFLVWEKVSAKCNLWYMDLGRFLVSSSVITEGISTADSPTKYSRVRTLAGYSFEEWIRYVSRSCCFLSGQYAPESNGPLDAICSGIPTIVGDTKSIPDDYPFRSRDVDEIADMVVDVYKNPRSVVKKTRPFVRDLREQFSFTKAVVSANMIMEEIVGLL